ncbi:MAG: hypothetical protein MUP27_09215 [Desulfobacterales bacterium]|nr:hypothetical protein [Desulfobacterales bacterium]
MNLIVAIKTVDGQLFIGEKGDIHATLADRYDLLAEDYVFNSSSFGFWIDGQYMDENELRISLNLN